MLNNMLQWFTTLTGTMTAHEVQFLATHLLLCLVLVIVTSGMGVVAMRKLQRERIEQ